MWWYQKDPNVPVGFLLDLDSELEGINHHLQTLGLRIRTELVSSLEELPLADTRENLLASTVLHAQTHQSVIIRHFAARNVIAKFTGKH